MKSNQLGRVAAALILALILAGCAKPAEVPTRERTPTSWDVELAPPGEPGDRLIVTGAVYRRGHFGPLVGVTIYAYHQDSKGNYFLAGHESGGPRLSGILRTDSLGRYRLRTVLPGGGEGNPHIHFEVWGRGIERQSLVLNLPGRGSRTPVIPSPVIRWGPKPVNEVPLLTRDSSGVFHCAWDLQVK